MARRGASLPSSSNAWLKFVKIRVKVFCVALDTLNVTGDIINDEDEISKALNPKLLDVCQTLKLKVGVPQWEAKNRPTTENDIKLPSSEKIPDFTCSHYDTSADPNKPYEINLHIECKRIGNNKPSWNLNRNYIDDGIDRFDSLSHEYGKRADDGIMIGYIVDSTKPEIQKEINEKLPENIKKLIFSTADKVESVKTIFTRKNVEPFDFILHHIWADFT